jgi:hypothetical protein
MLCARRKATPGRSELPTRPIRPRPSWSLRSLIASVKNAELSVDAYFSDQLVTFGFCVSL